jgi:hypothetical protein
MAGSQRDDQLSSQIPHVVGQDRFRRRVTRGDLSVSGSARRPLKAQLNASNVEPVRHLDFGNRSPRLLVADPRVKRAPNKKECRALTLSRLRHNSTSSRSSGRKVARLPRPITAKATDSPKVDRRGNQKKRHGQGRNNFGAITPAAPERETPGPLFLLTTVRGNLCETQRAWLRRSHESRPRCGVRRGSAAFDKMREQKHCFLRQSGHS